ncbi:acyltransferase [Saccharopolyspora sp. HNM0983]|uniref:Acyltransferase n=1 Tax=Saccharopolyspora montiporae TaxID=2781240 RepID=A0A929B938_9PSEU|nr:acyltransferase [Saccharopolyspora sp. HNM0983]MBE9375527.1 acyltransferase [Saccharopolyspora sp. HNM0983]
MDKTPWYRERVPEKTTTPTQTKSGKSKRKISWDVVRAGCVILVMIYHSTFLSVFLHPELAERSIRFPFQVGASMLLVISAYFACVTIGRGGLLRYWWGRMARLFPPFVGAVLLIFGIMHLAAIEGWFLPTWQDLLANVAMLWNWKPDEFFFIDGSHWTVPLQLMGFTAAALLFKSKLGHGTAIRVVLWVAVIVPILQWPIRVGGAPEAYRMIVDGIGAHRWHLFVVGVAIWMWSTRRIGWAHFAALLATCMLGQSLHNYEETPEGLVADWGSTVGVCIGMLVVAATAYGPDWNRVIPDAVGRWVTWFAGISYGVFLVHQTIGYIVSRTLQDIGAGPFLQVMAMLTTGVLLGWALTRLVERPTHTFLMNGYDRLAARRAAGAQQT